MELYAGYLADERVVHLTTRSFLVEALCSQTIALDGEPDGALICEDCHELALEAGGEASTWVIALEARELQAAA